MKRILFAALCVAAISATHAQVVCNTWGNQTTCNGAITSSPAPQIAPVAMPDFGGMMARQQAAQAQAEALRAQAQLAAQQTEYLRQQNADRAAQRSAAMQAQQQDESDWYNRYLACIKRFSVTNSSDQATAINARCKENTEAVPPAPQKNMSSTGSAEKSGTASPIRQKWHALDDALANGVITRAEYDQKLSGLLKQLRQEQSDASH